MMVRTQISLSEEDRRVLDRASARTGRSLASLVRDAVQASYGDTRDVESGAAALQASFGAWPERDQDGAAYVDRLRSGSRLPQR